MKSLLLLVNLSSNANLCEILVKNNIVSALFERVFVTMRNLGQMHLKVNKNLLLDKSCEDNLAEQNEKIMTISNENVKQEDVSIVVERE